MDAFPSQPLDFNSFVTDLQRHHRDETQKVCLRIRCGNNEKAKVLAPTSKELKRKLTQVGQFLLQNLDYTPKALAQSLGVRIKASFTQLSQVE